MVAALLLCSSVASFAVERPPEEYTRPFAAQALHKTYSGPWKDAPDGANRAFHTLSRYVDLSGLSVPELGLSDRVCDSDTAVGCYNGSIALVKGLSESQVFYVTLHELLHWGQFADESREAYAQEVWRMEHNGLAWFENAHWNTSKGGTHRRSGMSANAEIMDPFIGFSGNRAHAYLSAATLAGCTRFNGRGVWCVETCVDVPCVSTGDLWPRVCGLSVDAQSLNKAEVFGYTLASVVGGTFIVLLVSVHRGW